jgi:hypothetical protein
MNKKSLFSKLVVVYVALCAVVVILSTAMIVQYVQAGSPPPRDVEGSGPHKCAPIFIGSIAPVTSDETYLARGVVYAGPETDWSGADFVWLEGRLCGDEPQTVAFIDDSGSILGGARLQLVDGTVVVIDSFQESWYDTVADPTWRPRQR